MKEKVALGSLSIGSYLVGGVDELITAYIILAMLELASKIMVSLGRNKIKICSELKRKTCMLFIIIAAVQLDKITGNSEQFIRNATIMFLISVEGIGFTQSLRVLGVSIPPHIYQYFAQLKESSNAQSENDAADKNEKSCDD
ncbi:phage holin family protein [Jeotgalibacillus soli]|uniref:Holin n=1 Tax=Jeotgalibacillus soli TaxID=889306 RepID=A0A0C2V0N5_9BACL|nr:phage holin family protein [Jeotgalibacillus soli]KIL42627.1 hypothetical protein KP78_38500 [Jeotgalibacillus soli]